MVAARRGPPGLTASPSKARRRMQGRPRPSARRRPRCRMPAPLREAASVSPRLCSSRARHVSQARRCSRPDRPSPPNLARRVWPDPAGQARFGRTRLVDRPHRRQLRAKPQTRRARTPSRRPRQRSPVCASFRQALRPAASSQLLRRPSRAPRRPAWHRCGRATCPQRCPTSPRALPPRPPQPRPPRPHQARLRPPRLRQTRLRPHQLRQAYLRQARPSPLAQARERARNKRRCRRCRPRSTCVPCPFRHRATTCQPTKPRPGGSEAPPPPLSCCCTPIAMPKPYGACVRWQSGCRRRALRTSGRGRHAPYQHAGPSHTSTPMTNRSRM